MRDADGSGQVADGQRPEGHQGADDRAEARPVTGHAQVGIDAGYVVLEQIENMPHPGAKAGEGLRGEF
jgi:hypothetical protein